MVWGTYSEMNYHVVLLNQLDMGGVSGKAIIKILALPGEEVDPRLELLVDFLCSAVVLQVEWMGWIGRLHLYVFHSNKKWQDW